MTAKELTDVNVDHLTLMTYISKFQNITPRKSKDEKLIIHAKLDSLKAGDKVRKIVSFMVKKVCRIVEPDLSSKENNANFA